MVITAAGCRTTARGNDGMLTAYPVPSNEAQWIRNGEPIEFEGDLWYPADGIENFRDAEVLSVSEYRNVQVFVDRVDVRPYDRLYTKFSRNKFRFYEKRRL